MTTRKPLNNSALTGMFLAGGVLLVLGLIMWVANTDFDPETYGPEPNPPAQFFGVFMAGIGAMFLALGCAAAAICRQIADQD